MKRIILRGASATVWAAVALASVLLAATFLPTIFGFESLVVTSGSMGRTMPVGAVALTRAVEARAISVGDVISFRRRPGAPTTTHRVIDLRVDGERVTFTTQGDANRAPDPEPVVVAGRVHRVEYVVPVAGRIVGFARSPAGGVSLLLVPLVGLAAERPLRAIRARRRRLREVPGWSATTLAFERLTGGRAGGH